MRTPRLVWGIAVSALLCWPGGAVSAEPGGSGAESDALNTRFLQQFGAGAYADSLVTARRELELRLGEVPQDPVRVGVARNNVALAMVSTGDIQAALPLYQQAVQALGGHPEAAVDFETVLVNQGEALNAAGRPAEAIGPFLTAMLARKRRIPDSLQLADVENRLGVVLFNVGRYAEAVPLFESARRTFEAAAPAQAALALQELRNEARARFRAGDNPGAAPLYERLLQQRVAAADSSAAAWGVDLNDNGIVLAAIGRTSEAERAYGEALKVFDSVGDGALADKINVLSNLGALLSGSGRATDAADAYERAAALAVRLGARGRDQRAAALQGQGVALLNGGKLDAARGPLEAAASAWAEDPPRPADVAWARIQLGSLLVRQGHAAEAVVMERDAVGVIAGAWPESDWRVAASWALYADSCAASFLPEEAIRAASHVSSNTSASVTYRAMADNAVLEARRWLGTGRVPLAEIQSAWRQHQMALRVADAAGDRVRVLSAVAGLNQVGLAHMARGDMASAGMAWSLAAMWLRRYDAEETVLGAGVISNLGGFDGWAFGNAAAARRYERASAIARKLQADAVLAQTEENLAMIALRQRHVAAVLSHLQAAGDARFRVFDAAMVWQTADQRRSMISAFRENWDFQLSVPFRYYPHDGAAARVALDTVLRSRGYDLDAEVDMHARLQRDLTPEAGALVAELRELRAEQERLLSLDEPRGGATGTLGLVRTQIDAVETRLAADASASRVIGRVAPTSSAVAARLGDGEVLVEFVRFRWHNRWTILQSEMFGAEHYGALVLTPSGDVVAHDLGEARDVDALVGDARRQVLARSRTSTDALSKLYNRLLQPVLPDIATTRRLYVVPDGALHLLPFAALVPPDHGWVRDRLEVVLLSSGRDLLRPPDAGVSGGESLVLGDPDYDSAVGGGADSGARVAPVPRLDGSRFEVEGIAATLPGARLIEGAAATTEEVLRARHPRILHLATHGYAPDLDPPATSARSVAHANTQSTPSAVQPGDVLASAGVLLAGYNQSTTTRRQGVLSGADLALLDLDGTELVVLSACSTGVGTTGPALGLYGLRRALVIAGSRSQVLSLWPVHDEATAALMETFYRGLAMGKGRAEALRDAQRVIASDPRWGDPYYWAGFVLSGEAGPLTETPQ